MATREGDVADAGSREPPVTLSSLGEVGWRPSQAIEIRVRLRQITMGISRMRDAIVDDLSVLPDGGDPRREERIRIARAVRILEESAQTLATVLHSVGASSTPEAP